MVATGWSPLRSRRQASWLARWIASSASANWAGVGDARRVHAELVAEQGEGGRLVDRLPPEEEVAERLGHPVDVAVPVDAVLLVDEPAQVVANQPGSVKWCRQAHTEMPASRAAVSICAVVLDGGRVVASLASARAGPTRATGGGGSARGRRRAAKSSA